MVRSNLRSKLPNLDIRVSKRYKYEILMTPPVNVITRPLGKRTISTKSVIIKLVQQESQSHQYERYYEAIIVESCDFGKTV